MEVGGKNGMLKCWNSGMLGGKKDSVPRDSFFHHSNWGEALRDCFGTLRETDGISQSDRFANPMAEGDGF
jgi:hypothetical protein